MSCIEKCCCPLSPEESYCEKQPITCYYGLKFCECIDTPSSQMRCDKCAPASEDFPQCIMCFPCYFPICLVADIISFPCREIKSRKICCKNGNENENGNRNENNNL